MPSLRVFFAVKIFFKIEKLALFTKRFCSIFFDIFPQGRVFHSQKFGKSFPQNPQLSPQIKAFLAPYATAFALFRSVFQAFPQPVEKAVWKTESPVFDKKICKVTNLNDFSKRA
ncbi:MAG: hypothetical protein IKC31_02315 [Clostridia bacterium]|nr:hypothetical protein [Clostridia bacterium]